YLAFSWIIQSRQEFLPGRTQLGSAPTMRQKTRESMGLPCLFRKHLDATYGFKRRWMRAAFDSYETWGRRILVISESRSVNGGAREADVLRTGHGLRRSLPSAS